MGDSGPWLLPSEHIHGDIATDETTDNNPATL